MTSKLCIYHDLLPPVVVGVTLYSMLHACTHSNPPKELATHITLTIVLTTFFMLHRRDELNKKTEGTKKGFPPITSLKRNY